MTTADSFQRPNLLTDREDPAVLYAISLLLIRALVGIVGILLPIILIIGEAWFLDGNVSVRGSISAYYHTSMRDVFVGALAVVGFLLATYMAGQSNTKDFRWSLLAGLAGLGVVFFPTGRPGIADGAPLCGATPAPNGCAAIQQQLGETLVGTLHFVAAAVFILSLARICLLFAYRESEYKGAEGIAKVLRICAAVIVVSIGFIAVGSLINLNLGRLTPLYIGEVAAVWAFGVAWIVKARDLRAAIN